MLVTADIITGSRILLNELVEAFWYSVDFDEWLKQAALDISARTYSYEVTESISLVTGTQTYTLTTEYLRIHGAKYMTQPKGLLRISPWMEGIQEVPVDGPPKYYSEFAQTIEFTPKPTTAENGKLVTVYCSSTTSVITNIKNKYRTAAILFVTAMGLIKERQYSKGASLLQIYEGVVNSDLQNNFNIKIAPPSLDTYVLKPTTQGQQ